MFDEDFFCPCDRITVERVAGSTPCTAVLLLNDNGSRAHTIAVASRCFLHTTAEGATDGNKIRPGVISAERVSLTIGKGPHCRPVFLPERAQAMAGMCRSCDQEVNDGGMSVNIAVLVTLVM